MHFGFDSRNLGGWCQNVGTVNTNIFVWPNWICVPKNDHNNQRFCGRFKYISLKYSFSNTVNHRINVHLTDQR